VALVLQELLQIQFGGEYVDVKLSRITKVRSVVKLQINLSKALVERGFTVIMACRSRDKALAAIDIISASSGKAVF
jgi:hypothetical protein